MASILRFCKTTLQTLRPAVITVSIHLLSKPIRFRYYFWFCSNHKILHQIYIPRDCSSPEYLNRLRFPSRSEQRFPNLFEQPFHFLIQIIQRPLYDIDMSSSEQTATNLHHFTYLYFHCRSTSYNTVRKLIVADKRVGI